MFPSQGVAIDLWAPASVGFISIDRQRNKHSILSEKALAL